MNIDCKIQIFKKNTDQNMRLFVITGPYVLIKVDGYSRDVSLKLQRRRKNPADSE